MLRALKRLYLMAHAPAEPQPWFKPAVAERKPQCPSRPDALTDEERRELDGWTEGFLSPQHMKQPRARTYAAAWEAHKAVDRTYAQQVAYLTLVEWPAAWADAVLSHSNPTRKDKP